MKNKILIVAASVGGGHLQAAKALQMAAAKLLPAAKVEIADCMAATDSFFSHCLKKVYLYIINKIPLLYRFLYFCSAQQFVANLLRPLTACCLRPVMQNLIKRHQPDILIFTHPFPCAAAAALQRTGHLPTPLYGVITDFVIHPLWLYPEVKHYFIAAPELLTPLLPLKINSSFAATGIPINPEFALATSQAEALALLGFKQQTTLLIMGGSLGLNTMLSLLQAIDTLPLPVNVMAVAGKNKALYQQLSAFSLKSHQEIHVWGYCTEIPLLMAAADLLLTKPGGLTCSEALAVKLPLILYDALPGQEEDNALFLCDKGAALYTKSTTELQKVLIYLIDNPAKLTALKAAASSLGKALAAAAVIQQLIVDMKQEKLL